MAPRLTVDYPLLQIVNMCLFTVLYIINSNFIPYSHSSLDNKGEM
jgi:hypothetical protein